MIIFKWVSLCELLLISCRELLQSKWHLSMSRRIVTVIVTSALLAEVVWSFFLSVCHSVSMITLLNRFRTEQGHCGACRKKWQLTDTDLCPCGETQTMSHIVESCPLTKLNGGLSRLHCADEDAVSWLTYYGKWHAYEKKKYDYWKSNELILLKLGVMIRPASWTNWLTFGWAPVPDTDSGSFLSASLYVSKRGAYWDRLCRDVVGRWLVGRWLSRVHCGQTVHPRPIVTMEH